MIVGQVICDSCGSNNIKYDGGSDPNGDGLCFNWICNECGSQGVDCYKPTFTPQYINQEWKENKQ